MEKGSKKNLSITISILLVFVVGFFTGKSFNNQSSIVNSESKNGRKIKYWQAPMDPSYIRNEPGKSPMGMDLIPVYEDEEETGAGVIKINPAVVQNMGVRTAKVKKGRLEKLIRTVGHIDYNERKIGYVTTKMSGWIEKLYVDYTGQEVKKGDPLFEIYSPELVSAQEEYLLSLKSKSANGTNQFRGDKKRLRSLYKSAKQRLKYWDISDRQIKKLERDGSIKKTLTIYSPFNGIVVHKNVIEGQYQKAGTNLYKIADISTIWTYVHIYEYELPWIKIGLEAEMELSYIPGKVFTGTVTYIYPYLSKKTRDVKVRLEFDNSDLELKPDMYANIKIKSTISEETAIIPEEAIINTGSKQIAFIAKGEGMFEPRELTVGMEGEDGIVQILDGVSMDEVVVISGQFLLDSESKLQEAINKMLKVENAHGSGNRSHEMKHEGHKMEHDGHDMKDMKHDMNHGKHKVKHKGHDMEHSEHKSKHDKRNMKNEHSHH